MLDNIQYIMFVEWLALIFMTMNDFSKIIQKSGKDKSSRW